jgi:energy-coupling factor transporter ATP-binding protein EcfA2
MSNKWMQKLSKLDGAVLESLDPYSTVIQTVSPSLNYCFGKGWGMPLGFSAILYGPPGSGKSLITHLLTGGVHHDTDDGIVVRFDTELRANQLPESDYAKFGIDKERYMVVASNNPADIYDQIEKKLATWCEEGMPIKLIIIDSINQVQGLRNMSSDTITNIQPMDVGKVNKEGLKRILGVQRKYGFALVMTSHVSVEMDQWEIKRGNKHKMAASTGVQAHAELNLLVEREVSSFREKDLLGNDLVIKNQDLGEKLELAFKVAFSTKKNSLGTGAGRAGGFTFDYRKGVVNTHEEIFNLCKHKGILERPNNRTWVFGDKQWTGEDNMIIAVRDDPQLQEQLIKKLKELELGVSDPVVNTEEE